MQKIMLTEIPALLIRTEHMFPEIQELGVEFKPAKYQKHDCFELVLPTGTVSQSAMGQSTSYVHVLIHKIPAQESVIERRYYSVFNGQYVGSVLQKVLMPHP